MSAPIDHKKPTAAFVLLFVIVSAILGNGLRARAEGTSFAFGVPVLLQARPAAPAPVSGRDTGSGGAGSGRAADLPRLTSHAAATATPPRPTATPGHPSAAPVRLSATRAHARAATRPAAPAPARATGHAAAPRVTPGHPAHPQVPGSTGHHPSSSGGAPSAHGGPRVDVQPAAKPLSHSSAAGDGSRAPVAVGLVTGPGAPQVSLRLLGHRAVTVRLALPVSPRTPAATPAAPGD